MLTDRQFRLPRKWSNKELKKVAPIFKGAIVNISAWDDRDKEGGYYKNYFSGVRSYYYTNYKGTRGIQNLKNEIYLDLTATLPEELVERFDVVFNHTTLEHIYDIRMAFNNICRISKDVVILIVPFAQVQHETESWHDYWRFTPSCIRRMFFENGMHVIYESESIYSYAGTYLFFVASRFPESWRDKMPEYRAIKIAGRWIGQNYIKWLLQKVGFFK